MKSILSYFLGLDFTLSIFIMICSGFMNEFVYPYKQELVFSLRYQVSIKQL